MRFLLKHGRNWGKANRELFPDRNAKQLKNRYGYLQRTVLSQAVIQKVREKSGDTIDKNARLIELLKKLDL